MAYFYEIACPKEKKKLNPIRNCKVVVSWYNHRVGKITEQREREKEYGEIGESRWLKKRRRTAGTGTKIEWAKGRWKSPKARILIKVKGPESVIAMNRAN